ncbi:MAG: competence/damage-inducible protein A [Saprospiraceae bacterium]|jgi:nicotinamide-nucleotide amidase
MQVSILTVGDEILIGQIVDTNSAWMGQQLNLAGASVRRILSVGDELEAIRKGLDQTLEAADIVLMTGGLGPTKDDITKKALAEYMGVELVFHEPTFERIVRIFEKFNRKVTDAHRQQGFLPANAEVLPNKMGTAPGMWMEWNGKVIISMPGVPFEMKYLMEHEVLPRLKTRFPGKPIAHRTILTAGEGESIIAETLSEWEDRLPQNLKLAYLPSLGQVRLRITGTSDDEQTLNAVLDQKAAELNAILGNIVYSAGSDQLEAAIGRMLVHRKLKLATAESCTGGYLAHLLTSIPGASAYFVGSILAYSNEVKSSLLGVNPETLDRYGAVSQQTVVEMARGALGKLPADLVIAISGIAGPDGGTPEKPVGTVWIAIGNTSDIRSFQIHAGKDRLKNIQFSAVHALNQLRLFLQQHYPTTEG